MRVQVGMPTNVPSRYQLSVGQRRSWTEVLDDGVLPFPRARAEPKTRVHDQEDGNGQGNSRATSAEQASNEEYRWRQPAARKAIANFSDEILVYCT